MFEKILEEIKNAHRIIIHRHKNPDGDALGCQIGLKYILKENFPEKEVYAVGDAALAVCLADFIINHSRAVVSIVPLQKNLSKKVKHL